MTDWGNLNSRHIPSELGRLAIKLERADREVEELSDQLDLNLTDPKYIDKFHVALNRYALLLEEWRAALKYFQGNNP